MRSRKGLKKPDISLTFGRIVIDELHQFFGEPDPIPFIIADAWSNELEDGEDKSIWCEHFRGHIQFTYRDLRDKKRFTITNDFIDPTKNILKQLEYYETQIKL